uniref:Uncharacterized protein n=1 Tax=Ditylenchus dipsaci TaxID=166011 RepID=A0A915CT48_9BILA
MSLLWKLKLDGDEPGRLLFNKLSSTESECNACAKKIPTSNKDYKFESASPETSAIQRATGRDGESRSSEEGGHAKGLQQFVIKGTGRQCEGMLEACRKLVGHFNHSTLAKDRLKDEQKSARLPENRLLQV